MLLSACSGGSLLKKNSSRDDYFVIWAHSDLQPRNEKERKDYETAVADVSANIGSVDCAVVAGDIIQGATGSDPDADFRWYESVKKKAPVKRWYEIAGNHDGRFMESYTQNTGQPLHYAVRYGSLLMIFLSDENGKTSGSEISDAAFEWWKNLVEKYRGSIIFTVTHTNLDGAGFKYGLMSYRNIAGSKRFEEVLGKEKLDLWLSGHTHSPSKLDINEVMPGRFHTMFLNIASIRKDFFFSQTESRFLILKKGSNVLTVKTRYHDREKFVGMREFDLELSSPFVWDGKEPEMTVFGK